MAKNIFPINLNVRITWKFDFNQLVFNALWADALYKSICPSVCLSVHFLRYRLHVFLPPFPTVWCPKFLEILNPWGKVMARSGLLLIKGVKSQHKQIFFGKFCLFSPLPKVQCQNFLVFQNPWGKVMERNGLRFKNLY